MTNTGTSTEQATRLDLAPEIPPNGQDEIPGIPNAEVDITGGVSDGEQSRGLDATLEKSPEAYEASPPQLGVLARQATDDRPWSIFTSGQKKAIVLATAVAGFFSPASGSIYFPALNVISADLNVSIDLVNLSVTTYLVSYYLSR